MSRSVKAAMFGLVISVVLSLLGVGISGLSGTDPIQTAILVHVSAISVLVVALFVRSHEDES